MKKISKTEFFVSKKIGKAMTDYGMLDDKDRILVGVSGGKDSLALLKILRDRQRFVPIKHEIIAVHVNSDYENAKVVKDYLKENKYKYYIKKVNLGTKEPKRKKQSKCFWCSWKRRDVLFKLARKLKCKKIVLAHHKDDIIQTQLMNLFFQGEISTMAPKQKMFKGKLYIIRPLAYVEEYELVKIARENKFPVLPNICPESKVTNRRYMKRIIANLQKACPYVKDNIFRSLKRIKKDYLIGI